jgi:hypothetical protein
MPRNRRAYPSVTSRASHEQLVKVHSEAGGGEHRSACGGNWLDTADRPTGSRVTLRVLRVLGCFGIIKNSALANAPTRLF